MAVISLLFAGHFLPAEDQPRSVAKALTVCNASSPPFPEPQAVCHRWRGCQRWFTTA